MANYNKSFNFRNGVQVDNDNFIVNANGLVGIGTSIPREFLDVYGTAKVTGLVTATNLAITGVSTFYSNVRVGSGITLYASTGIISATAFYGDGSNLLNVEQVAVDGWIVNAGNLSTTSKVGIGTDIPNYSLQVGQDPITGNGLSIDEIMGNVNTTGIITATRFSGPVDGITDLNASVITSGTLNNARLPQNINVSGIVTAYSFTGFGTNLQGINATNITNGTLNNSRLPQDISITGIITASNGVITSLTNTNLNNTGIATLTDANISRLSVSGVTTSTGGFVGNVVGIASTARSLTGSPNITVSNVTSSTINNTGILTSSSINNIENITSGTLLSGISTVSTRLYAESIGVGTNSPSSDIHIRRSSQSRLQVTSDTAEAIIAVGRSTTLTGSNGALRFGNTSGIYPYSTAKTLDIINYDTGNLNYYLNYSTGSGNIGDFNWIYGPDATNPLMTLTYEGNLGIGVTNPTNRLEIFGSAQVSSLTITNDLYVSNTINADITGTASTATNVSGGTIDATSAYISGITTSFGGFIGDLTGNVVGNSDTATTAANVFGGNVENVEFVGIGTAEATSRLYVVGDTLVTGVTTSQGGFTSGIGVSNPVKITVSGNILTFTVTGVGFTSLTLY